MADEKPIVMMDGVSTISGRRREPQRPFVDLDIPSCVAVGRDAAIEGRYPPSGDDIQSVVVQMARFSFDELLQQATTAERIESHVRYIINAEPEDLTDDQLRLRYAFDELQPVESRRDATRRRAIRRGLIK